LDQNRVSAYVKIAEGCSRKCSFCIIPSIKGPLRSRRMESVVREVSGLGGAGIREVNLVAQDTTAYRAEGGNHGLCDLLAALDDRGGVPWIRVLYGYPCGVNRRLMDAISGLPRLCEYLDIPLQHSSERVLSRMRRPCGRFAARPLIERLRAGWPQIALRTTFIVGFPGERESDFSDLERFVGEGHFLHAGVFEYSPEEGTAAAGEKDSVPRQAKRERRMRLMRAQQSAAERRLRTLVGGRIEVLLEGVHEESDLLWAGRCRFQAPEVDGRVIIGEFPEGTGIPSPGDLVSAEVLGVKGFDLSARAVDFVGRRAGLARRLAVLN